MPVPPEPNANASSLSQLRNNLTNHRPNAEAVGHIEQIRRTGKELGMDIIVFCPGGRERSLALTNLEQTVMWAVAAIVREPKNWEEEADG